MPISHRKMPRMVVSRIGVKSVGALIAKRGKWFPRR
jgi:hypothetical protein